MQTFLQVLAAAVITVTAILVLKKYNGKFGLLLALVCICSLCVFALTLIRPVMDMMHRL